MTKEGVPVFPEESMSDRDLVELFCFKEYLRLTREWYESRSFLDDLAEVSAGVMNPYAAYAEVYEQTEGS